MATAVEATELTEQQPPSSIHRPKSEFDPCCNAKVTSPFYLYNHDSPRPSVDVKKPCNPVQVAIQDLEAGTFNLSPSITQEKKDAQNSAARDRFKFWKREKQCMTKPKPRGCVWFTRLSPRQRLLVKLLVGLMIIGAAVGIAVGVSIKVHGTVYKGNNSTSQIG
ncbi:uncharacterized protein Z519_04385 [Cladophialophora bantiana CBS 173.52]|uniref:Uncharacterized protein n=1 Tax=Cladophialophora bantiana (strain ATCC 10958 / CBS 173.52 / CDC B-1940 / NIH 8579) TaxID=1442370 RepID=A0A0D2ICA2_CLAB1|nr:uncharacterized protein Z519_04385 [Cladophialophora bantiana CBS 173.52]KIW94409.1 hypothetical protein Z519_04385 [Cladophialophora bantiana CBS 173.52]